MTLWLRFYLGSSASRASADLFKSISEAIVWLWGEGIRQKLGQWYERIHSLVSLEESMLPIFQESSSEGCSFHEEQELRENIAVNFFGKCAEISEPSLEL